MVALSLREVVCAPFLGIAGGDEDGEISRVLLTEIPEFIGWEKGIETELEKIAVFATKGFVEKFRGGD